MRFRISAREPAAGGDGEEDCASAAAAALNSTTKQQEGRKRTEQRENGNVPQRTANQLGKCSVYGVAFRYA